MQHYRDVQLARSVEICTPHGWIGILFVSLKVGDIFRMTETRVGEQDDHPMEGVWQALSDAKSVTYQGFDTIAVDCEPYSEERQFGDT